MRFEEYRKHDAISLAGLIAKREVSAEEILETAIARAEHCVIVEMPFSSNLTRSFAVIAPSRLRVVPFDCEATASQLKFPCWAMLVQDEARPRH
jgi:hypothetical protein